jgi:hypothetical protein
MLWKIPDGILEEEMLWKIPVGAGAFGGIRENFAVALLRLQQRATRATEQQQPWSRRR